MDLSFISEASWSDEPRGWRDVIRCLFGRHRPITMAVDHDAPSHFALISRCSCGAIHFGGGWMESHPFTRRKASSN